MANSSFLDGMSFDSGGGASSVGCVDALITHDDDRGQGGGHPDGVGLIVIGHVQWITAAWMKP